VKNHDTAAVFDWLISALSYQGISDQIAYDYMEEHGYVSWDDQRKTRPRRRPHDGCARFGETIRLSSDIANPLGRSRNWRADGGGCSACAMQVWRGGGLKGLTVDGWKRALARTVERSRLGCRKLLRRSFCFNRVTGL
jgi:hypothetical protein